MITEIIHDVYFISKRIKEIDSDYLIVYNYEKARFEVHTKGQPNIFCLAVPFDNLDARTLDYVQKTRVCNVEKLFAEIDEQNEKKQHDANIQIIERLKGEIYEGKRNS